MFKFLPTPALPGFRVGLADDDTPGFNVASDGSTQPVLLDAPDIPAVDDGYPFRAHSPNRTDPAGMPPDASQNNPSDDGFQLARSAQAQAPQPPTPTDTSAGEVVVLPDGATIPDPKSSTGKVMAPTPYGLDPDQLKYITAGFKIGQSGVFGESADP